MELGFCYHRQKWWAEALPLLERGAAWVGPRLAARFPPPMIIHSILPGFIAGCRRRLAEAGQLTEPPVVLVNRQYNGHADFDRSEGATSLPLAASSEALGASVAWDHAAQSETATVGDRSITFTLGKAMASVQCPMVGGQLPEETPTTNNQQLTTYEVPFRVAPYLNEEGRMMVPLRPLVEALGGTVRWEPEAQIVYVDLPPAARSTSSGQASSQPPEEATEATEEPTAG